MYAVFLWEQTTSCEAYSFKTDGYAESLTCAQIWVSAEHTKGKKGGGESGTNKGALELTRRKKKKMFFTLPRQWNRTQALGIESPTLYH